VTNHDLSLEISALRDLVTRLGRGTYDDCDPELIKTLRTLAHDLYATVEITEIVNQH
jgi:hypothetical protein